MPLPEGYRPRKGDVLIVHCKVHHDVYPHESNVHLEVGERYNTTVIKLDHVQGVFSRHFETGEVVRPVGDMTGQTGEVVAVHEGMVWVKDGHGQMQTIAANELELAPALEQQFVEEPAPEHPHAMRSPAAVPLGGAYLPEPFCEPAPEPMDQEKLDRIG